MPNLYHQHPQVLCECVKTKTIRVMPSNYMVARHDGNHWLMDPDLAAPLDFVLLVTLALMDHSLRYSEPGTLKLLSAITGKDAALKLSVMQENKTVEQFADLVRR